jgi:hypothetical protein
MANLRPPVSQNQLATEMGKKAAQVNRWFTENDDRRVSPDMATVEEIEAAMHRLEMKRGR